MKFSAFDCYMRVTGQSDAGTPVAEEQNSDYESGTVLIGQQLWRVRTARVTPTKPGDFVAAWRRAEDWQTEPFGPDDPCIGLKVFVEEAGKLGVFTFDRAALTDLGITGSEQHPGKRGFRVYPVWCVGLNKQAARTQKAQAHAFAQFELAL